jgi:hypothetical protein
VSALQQMEEGWTEGQFEALVTLHMLKPGQVLTADDWWAIEYTRLQADVVENCAVDAFDNGRKHGMLSVAGQDVVTMSEKIDTLQGRVAVEKALRRYAEKRREAAEAKLQAMEEERALDREAMGLLLKAGGANPSRGVSRFSFWSLDKLSAAFDAIAARFAPTPPKE